MRRTYVPPNGPRDADIVLVGEQPGKQEVMRKKPFVGPAGKELDYCLQAAGIVRSACYLTNVIKDLDKPLADYIKHSRSTSVSPEANQYIEELRNELESVRPNVVVAVGNVALYALTSRWGIMSWRGSVLESTLIPGLKVIPTVHPATVIPPKFQYLNRRLIIFDLIRARNESAYPDIRRKPRRLLTSPSYEDAMGFLTKCHAMGKAGSIINFDIEVYNNEVSCISFAPNENESMSIPFIGPSGAYFDVGQEVEIWKKIGEILEDRGVIKLNQNIGFDAYVLLWQLGIKTHNMRDTMVCQKIILPDYPAGLDFITTTHTDIPYYKGEGKKWFKIGGTWETLWKYNAMDSIACQAAYPKQLEEIKQQGNETTVKRQTDIIEPLVFMMFRGIKVDVNGLRKAKDELDSEVELLQTELNDAAGVNLNFNSPKQLSWYFYTHLGHKPYLKKGKITTDDTALVRLARKGVREAALVKRLRHLKKLSGTYLNIDKISPDGRIRCSYNPAGTKTGRLSSSENIFGEGMNLQNWPHELLRYLVPDDGYVAYNVDLSQAENRIVAYVGRIERMIQAFENEEDVHRLTAGLIFNKPPSEVSAEDGSCPLGDGSHSERFYGKKSNHSLNYDLGYKKFALILEIPEREAKWLVERYHAIYPEVRNNYHAYIRAQLSKNRTVVNLMGRKRLFLDRWGDALFKDAYAQIPQSTVADIINERGLTFMYEIPEVVLVMQVHDAVAFQISLEVPWHRHAEILLAIKRSLEVPLQIHGTEFVIPADFEMSTNFGHGGIEMKHTKFPTNPSELADMLEWNWRRLEQSR